MHFSNAIELPYKLFWIAIYVYSYFFSFRKKYILCLNIYNTISDFCRIEMNRYRVSQTINSTVWFKISSISSKKNIQLIASNGTTTWSTAEKIRIAYITSSSFSHEYFIIMKFHILVIYKPIKIILNFHSNPLIVVLQKTTRGQPSLSKKIPFSFTIWLLILHSYSIHKLSSW